MIDSFSGAASTLPKGRRTALDVLRTLARAPRVSTWDMSELRWLRSEINDLLKRGLIESAEEPYPWHRYVLTDAGRAAIEASIAEAAA